jgi:hypothetical protein
MEPMSAGNADDLDRVVAAARRLKAPDAPAILVPHRAEDALGVPARASGWGRHLARLVISDEYVPQFLNEQGALYGVDKWPTVLLNLCHRDDLLRVVTAATRVAHEGGAALDEWTNYVLDTVDPALGKHLRAALTVTDGGPPRVFMARQPLLLALKLILEGGTTSPAGSGDPFVVVTLLAHYAAREPAGRTPPATGPTIGGLPAPLAMELVQNSLFHSGDGFGDLLARTHLLWTSYEARLVRHRPRVPLRQMLAEATGIDLDDMLTMAFALFSQANEAKLRDIRMLDLASLRLPQPAVDAFLARFSITDAELTKLMAKQAGPWAFLPLEDTPLLRIGPTSVAVLDERLLQRRFTSALYWLVHDHEKSVHGEQARRAWTQTYSELVEIHAEDILARLAPTLLGSGSTFFTEEQLGLLGDSAVDCGIDFGDFVLLTDVVQHQMTVPTRMLGEVSAFEADMKATVLKKAKQLNGSARALLTKEGHRAHPLGRRPERILPVVLQGADFPVNRATMAYAREKAASAGLLAQPECAPLVIVTLDELEMVEALVQSGVTSADEVFRGYAASGADDSLRNFIVDHHGGAALRRSEPIQQALDAVFDAVTQRLDHLTSPAV